MSNTLTTTWQTLTKIATIENKKFFYYEYETYYELFLIISPVLFYAIMKKDGNKDTEAFETNFKSIGYQLN